MYKDYLIDSPTALLSISLSFDILLVENAVSGIPPSFVLVHFVQYKTFSSKNTDIYSR